MTVRVLEIEDMKGPNLKCYATLQIGPLIIYRCRLIQQLGQRGYVAPPQQEWLGPDGKVRYTPFLKWPDEWKEPILNAVKTAYQAQKAELEVREK